MTATENGSDEARLAPVNLKRMASASMLQGVVCLGGGLLLAAVVVIAGVRVFRNLRTGGN